MNNKDFPEKFYLKGIVLTADEGNYDGEFCVQDYSTEPFEGCVEFTRADLSHAPKADTPTPPNAALDALYYIQELIKGLHPKNTLAQRFECIESALRNTETKG